MRPRYCTYKARKCVAAPAKRHDDRELTACLGTA